MQCGILLPVGESRDFVCTRCGKQFVRRKYAANQRYCAECALQVRREKDRETHYRRRPKKPVRTKRCIECQEEFTIKQSWADPEACPACRTRRYGKKRPKRTIDPQKRRAYRVWHQYGITIEQLEELKERQGGVCAACGQPPRPGRDLSVDHDHGCCPGQSSCGKCVRGLLCHRCNSFLGHVQDQSEIVAAMIKYLKSGGPVWSPNRKRLQVKP